MSSANKLGLKIASPLLPVTGVWMVPFTAYNIFNSIRVCWERKNSKTLLGDTLPATNRNDLESLRKDPLYAAVRTQVNFLEITPWALVLGALAELNGARRSTLNYAFAILFVLRFWHGEGGLMSVGRRGLGRLIGYWGSMIWMATIGMLNLNLTRPVWSWN